MNNPAKRKTKKRMWFWEHLPELLIPIPPSFSLKVSESIKDGENENIWVDCYKPTGLYSSELGYEYYYCGARTK